MVAAYATNAVWPLESWRHRGFAYFDVSNGVLGRMTSHACTSPKVVLTPSCKKALVDASIV
jgi:hypothetical protein